MTTEKEELLAAINLLSTINKLTIKILSIDEKEALIFMIVNETIHIARYDRAMLWDISGATPFLLAISGQSVINAGTEFVNDWKSCVTSIKEIESIQVLSPESLSENKKTWEKITEPHKSQVLWYPITYNNQKKIAVLFERWNQEQWKKEDVEILNPLMLSYGIAWDKFSKKKWLNRFKNRTSLLIFSGLMLLLFTIQVPLRIVASCEVIPQVSVLITAPLEEIISEIKVQPGETISKGQVLFEYDQRIPLQDLKIAQNKLKISQQDLDRAQGLAYKEERSLSELGVLSGKVKKERVELKLAQYKASQLSVKSPVDGVVVMDDPDEWRGKPVHVGEKILSITDPNLSRIRLWVPENDNVVLDFQKPIKIILNVTPEISRKAKLVYISDVADVNDQKVSSYVGEAEWLEQQKDVKIGLKGTAILYGDDVSLIYWIIRKPLASLRNFTGL